MDVNDEPYVRHKDLELLRDPSGGGVEFEVNEYKDRDDENEDDIFKPEDVLNNIYIPEEDDDTDDDSSPYEKLAKKMVDISGDGGVMKRILQPGGGCIVPDEAIVKVHYNAFLEYGDEPFDSSRLRNRPERYKLGQGKLIPGLEIAVKTMKKGEIAQLLIKSDYAYGEMGVVPRIPPKATVMFKLELLHFIEHAGLDDYDMMTREERDKILFPEILKLVEVERQFGLQAYKENAFSRAFGHYKKGTQILENHGMKNEDDERVQEEKLVNLFINMAVCSSKQGKFSSVITNCSKARQYERNTSKQNKVKILFLQGKAHRKCQNFEAARDLLKKAQRLSPNSPEINTELQELDKNIKTFSQIEKDMYGKMFSRPKGQSEEEREKENEQASKKEEKALNVSADFQKMVENKLLEFIKDDDQDEMPFPSCNLNIGEIECMIDKAQNLGLDCKQIGTGSNIRMKITKPKSEGER